jgi:hypothetical protein
MSLLTGLPDSTGGYQSALVDKLRVRPSRHRHTMVHIAEQIGLSRLKRQSQPIIISSLQYTRKFAYTLLRLVCLSKCGRFHEPEQGFRYSVSRGICTHQQRSSRV